MTRTERAALSDRRLLDAAIELIVRHGTEGATLRRLGETAGYSRGLVTYRFGSKTGLFRAVLQQVGERWLAELEAAVTGKTGLAAMQVAAESYYRFVRSSPRDIRAMWILFHQATEPGSKLTETVSRFQRRQCERVADWIRADQQKGRIRANVQADTYATHFCALVIGMTFFWSLDRDFADWDRAHTELLLLLQRDLAPA